MNTKPRIKKSRSHVGHCPHCGNDTPLRLVAQHRCDAPAYTDDNGEDVVLQLDYYLAACSTCGDVSLYSGWEGSLDEDLAPFTAAYRRWPEPPLDERALPKTVAECYRDAVSVQAKSPPAFAVLARRTLEALCADKNAKGSNLASRLKALSDQGDLPPTIAGMTDVLRRLGNLGAHSVADRVTAEDAWIVDSVLRAVLEYVYVAPQALRDALNKLQARAERKAR